MIYQNFRSLELVLILMLMGCSTITPAASTLQTITNQNQVISSDRPVSTSVVAQGQNLPISAQVSIGEKIIKLEVASSAQQQALGLMYRNSLADDRGMLFPFDPPRSVNFWMKNVVINLDMIFLKDGQIVSIAANVPPCTNEPCPIYGPVQPIDQVIELRGGRAAELGLKEGDRLTVEFLP